MSRNHGELDEFQTETTEKTRGEATPAAPQKEPQTEETENTESQWKPGPPPEGGASDC